MPPWINEMLGHVLHPMVLLFLAAVVVTLWTRLTHWLGRGDHLDPTHLQETITVVAVASPGESVEPYLRLLQTARWPVRTSLRLFKMLGPQEAMPEHPTARISLRYGAFDRASERMRMLREGVGSEYVLVLGRPVESAVGWDELLLRMLRQCSGRSVLTSVPPMAQVGGGVGGTFLSVTKEGRRQPRPFAVPPERPQPSLFASAQMCFGRAECFEAAPEANATVEDALLSQALWMGGVDFFAPHVTPFHTINTDIDERTVRKLRSTDPPASVRTGREWALFCGKLGGGKWGRRAQLGLTPTASHEERYAKYGDRLHMHGL